VRKCEMSSKKPDRRLHLSLDRKYWSWLSNEAIRK
jgi:hypothetical protein